jgi:hypothetical protein
VCIAVSDVFGKFAPVMVDLVGVGGAAYDGKLRAGLIVCGKNGGHSRELSSTGIHACVVLANKPHKHECLCYYGGGLTRKTIPE